MEFRTQTTPEAVAVHLTGRLEFADHDRLTDIIALLDRSRAEAFVLDLSGLTFIDSAGLGMILILQEEAGRKTVRMTLRAPRGEVKRSIELARIREIVAIEP